jgi:hypothetical protein
LYLEFCRASVWGSRATQAVVVGEILEAVATWESCFHWVFSWGHCGSWYRRKIALDAHHFRLLSSEFWISPSFPFCANYQVSEFRSTSCILYW